MKKLLVSLFFLFSFLPLSLDDGDSPYALTKEEHYALATSSIVKDSYFSYLPKEPYLKEDSLIFEDPQLTKIKRTVSAQTLLTIDQLFLNEQEMPIFSLSDGGYVPASKGMIYDNSQVTSQRVSETYWTKSNTTVYDSPYRQGIKPIKNNLSAYHPYRATEEARTYQGNYVKLEGQGWVDKKQLSKTDNRMEKVQELLNTRYNKDNYAIYVKQLDTQTIASIHMDNYFYAASVAKLPLLYAVQEQINQKKVSLEDSLLYTEEVNQFPDAYDPSGSSQLPLTADHKSYTIKDLLAAVAEHSDNVATNILAYYLTNQYDYSYRQLISKIVGQSWSMTSRQATVEMAGLMMEALVKQNSLVLEDLSHTEFDDQRIAKNIKVRVAHKIGDAYEDRHDVAYIETTSPFILAIFTEKASYDDITAIADAIYEILK